MKWKWKDDMQWKDGIPTILTLLAVFTVLVIFSPMICARVWVSIHKPPTPIPAPEIVIDTTAPTEWQKCMDGSAKPYNADQFEVRLTNHCAIATPDFDAFFKFYDATDARIGSVTVSVNALEPRESVHFTEPYPFEEHPQLKLFGPPVRISVGEYTKHHEREHEGVDRCTSIRGIYARESILATRIRQHVLVLSRCCL